MVVHGIDPATGVLRPGVCLPVLGKLFSYQEINPISAPPTYERKTFDGIVKPRNGICTKCGRTSDQIKKEDALVELEQFECEFPAATKVLRPHRPITRSAASFTLPLEPAAPPHSWQSELL